MLNEIIVNINKFGCVIFIRYNEFYENELNQTMESNWSTGKVARQCMQFHNAIY